MWVYDVELGLVYDVNLGLVEGLYEVLVDDDEQDEVMYGCWFF